jgi:hypothetical protein
LHCCNRFAPSGGLSIPAQGSTSATNRRDSTSSRRRLIHIRTCQSRRYGGADRDRTDDILLAKQALSQLSYSPIRFSITEKPIKVVGLGRFELPTSPLSGVRSNQLSYRPDSTAPGIRFRGQARCAGCSVIDSKSQILSSLERFRGHS